MQSPAQTIPSQAGPDPLAGLRDWHLPDPVSWWPPAPGWWLLAAAVLVLALAGLLLWLRHRRGAAPARAALRELRLLGAQRTGGLDGRAYAAAVSALLRRLALVRYPRERVAGLTGEAWLAFLDSSLKGTGGAGGFSAGPGRALGDIARRPAESGSPGEGEGGRAPLDAPGLAALAERWIRAHGGTAT